MPQPAPGYFKRGGKDAAAEHLAFFEAAPESATRMLAELCALQNFGLPAAIPPADDKATSVRGLYCRKLKGWAAFYMIDPPPEPLRIHVLHVAPLVAGTFDALEAEAASRLRRHQIGD